MRFSKQKESGKIIVVSGISRLENHRVPSVAISGHNTGSSDKKHQQNMWHVS